MVRRKEAIQQALEAAFTSWRWPPPANTESFGPLAHSTRSSAAVSTEFSATLFSAEPEAWVRYLNSTLAERYEPELGVRVHVQRDLRLVAFEPESEPSRWLADLLGRSLRRLQRRLEHKPNVAAALDELLFGAASLAPVCVRLSPDLPCDGTRESTRHGLEPNDEVRIVLRSQLVRSVSDALSQDAPLSVGEKLGWTWPVLSRLVTALAFPSSPRDRFVTKIEVFAKLTYVAINLLYDGRKSGELLPSVAGAVFEGMVAESTGIPPGLLQSHHPYFRMLSKLGFMLRVAAYSSYAEDARIAAREYLDSLYLRLSLGGAMPPVAPAMQPMSFERMRRKVWTPAPEAGKYGILDLDDLDAWKTVAKPLRDLGFTLLRQLGLGEFSRVYEVLNDNNPDFPARVALKVDRIVGKKKVAILGAEEAMHVGRALACAPHLIRLYDTGKLRGAQYTYHVLQLIDGDTLDNLVGVTGTEHASISRPPSPLLSEGQAEEEGRRALSSRDSEQWRRARRALPFRHPLSPAMVLDLLTSVLLWLEEVHAMGYSSNDLKNGNLMMSRRGQLKGIDLDSYAPVHSSKDKVVDFMFLAASLVFLLFNAPVFQRGRTLPWEELIESEVQLRAGLSEAWPFGDVEALSDQRVTRAELTSVLVDLVQRSRHLVYAKEPGLFSQDLERLIDTKRRLLAEELVID